MANSTDHISQAKHNTECARRFLSGCRDWAITAAFYAAIHYVEAGLEQRSNLHSVGHTDRLKKLSTINKSCIRYYRNLEVACRRVRYLDPNSAGDALTYYLPKDAAAFIDIDLMNVKQELENSGIILS